MTGYEITEKLARFLDADAPFTAECHVVYLLVEVRKVIAHENAAAEYPILKFYADWSVHTEKDHITNEMQKIIVGIYDAVEKDITSSDSSGASHHPAMNFAYMVELRKEFDRFLHKHGIPTVLVQEDDRWISFVGLLVRVLTNQPILDSKDRLGNVKLFVFEPANEGCVIGMMEFKHPVGGKSFYRFGNAY